MPDEDEERTDDHDGPDHETDDGAPEPAQGDSEDEERRIREETQSVDTL